MRETSANVWSWILHTASRREWMAFAPALMLGVYWVSGEVGMLWLAVIVPCVIALVKVLSPSTLAPRARLEVLGGLSLRANVVAALDDLFATADITGNKTACFVIQFDDIAEFTQRNGHIALAEIATRTAERLCMVLRSGDVIARLEGGSFAVALAPVRRLDLETVVQLAARIQSALSAPISLNATRLYVSTGVGFCLSDRSPKLSGQALLDAAQIAADEATRQGPGAIRAYAPDMILRRADRHELREGLEVALDEGQIRAHFQPQISTETGEISGFEALARWYHPERGLISPAEFLPLIEQSGLSERLGEVMLYNGLLALTRWDKAGFHVPTVAVNFSATELRNPRLVEKIQWELDRFSIAPKRLSVEILETVVAETENDIVVSNIAALSRLGCGIDLDDFGTGSASITSLRRFAVRRIKIDRSFVTRLDKDPAQQKMVAAILSMAEQLGLETLAEGVETPSEHAVLAQLGCGYVQGFSIARPMPVDETMTWIDDHRQKRPPPIRIVRKVR